MKKAPKGAFFVAKGFTKLDTPRGQNYFFSGEERGDRYGMGTNKLGSV